MSKLETKEAAPALAALSKAKGSRSNRDVAIVRPANTMVEHPTNTESAITPAPAPESTAPATPEKQDPAPSNDGRGDYKESYLHLKQHYDTTVHELRTKQAQLETDLAAAKAPKVDLPRNKEELKAFKEKYPEAFDTMRAVAIEEANSQSESLKAQIAEVTKLQAELRDKEAFKELLKEHPDALEIRASTRFKEWYDEQPIEIQDILAKSKNIKAVAKQLALYKLEVLGINPKVKKEEEVKSIVDASLGVDVKTRTEVTSAKKIWTQTEINQVCADYKLWNKYRVEIDQARQEGRVDLTK